MIKNLLFNRKAKKNKELSIDSIVIDTNVLMNEPYILSELLEYNKVIIPMVVLEELDNINHNREPKASFKARRAIKEIFKNIDKENIFFDSYYKKNKKNDNIILKIAKRTKSSLTTFDINMSIKAGAMGINIFKIEHNERRKEKEYKGYQVWELNFENEADEFLLASLYSGSFDLFETEYEFEENEYLVIRDYNTREYITSFVLTSGKFEEVIREKTLLRSSYFKKVKPKDVFQTLAIHSLMNNKITMVKGTAGTGKTFLGITYAIKQIEDGKKDKIVFFANPVGAKNAAELGYYPGSRTEKLLDTNVGMMLSSKFGGKEGLVQLMERGQVEIVPFVDIRGYDTSGMNAIIYLLEAQNLDIELMKLGLQRVGDDCQVIIDGDYLTQTDRDEYSNGNNGMRRMAEIFRGSDIYGEVELKSIYRSNIAKLADMM